MRNVLVSIIIPVYNAEKYIERCIDSILSQTYDNWEVIAVNDGSTDKTLEKLNQYSYDKRITIIDIPNGGVVNARETALRNVAGQYLMFVDADDYLPIDAICLMVDKMSDTKADLVVGGYTLHWELDNRIKDVNNKKDFVTPAECIDYCLRYGETFLPVKMYRTLLFKQCVSIPREIVFMEDTIGVIQYLNCCTIVAVVNQSVYVYFKNKGSASMTVRPATLISMLRVSDFLMDYAETTQKRGYNFRIDKIGDLLFNVMGGLELIPEHKVEFNGNVLRYMSMTMSNMTIRDIILRQYVSTPSLARALHSCWVRLTRTKSVIKKCIWRMIH